MSTDTLLPYYRRQLRALREGATDFAARHPRVAAALELRGSDCGDPHIERLLESVAYLNARIERRLDDGVSELARAMIQGAAPHYLAPIPSMAIAQLALDPGRGRASKGCIIPSRTPMLGPLHRGNRCRFRSGWDVQLWPITLEGIRFVESGGSDRRSGPYQSQLEVTFQTFPGMRVEDLALDHLDLYLPGGAGEGLDLLAFLLRDVSRVEVDWDGRGDAPWEGPEPTLTLRGLTPEERLLPYDRGSAEACGLLWEFFAFPQAFRSIRVEGLSALQRCSEESFTLSFQSKGIPGAWSHALAPDALALGCVPIVNLFPQVAEPLRLKHQHHEMPIVPDRFRGDHLEVHSVLGVEGYLRGEGEPQRYRPALAPLPKDGALRDLRWSSRRVHRLSPSGPPSTVFLELGDLAKEPTPPRDEELKVRLLCTNHSGPAQLPFEGAGLPLMVESLPQVRGRCLTKPTPSIPSPREDSDLWPLVSTMEGWQVEAGDPKAAARALRACLQGADPLGSVGNRQLIDLIETVTVKPIASHIPGPDGAWGHVRGLGVEVALDGAAMDMPGIYRFGACLEVFLGHRAPVNTCRSLSLVIPSEPPLRYTWPPRAGEQVLL